MSEQEQPRPQTTSDPRKLYVSNLDPTYSNRKVEADLRELFLKFGDLLSVHVKRNERHNKLYAFILYKQPEQATEALQNMDGEHMGDTKIKVELQKGNRGPRERRQVSSSNAVTCYRCRKTGHFARECTQKIESYPDRRERGERGDGRQEKRKHRSRDKRRKSSSGSSSSSSSSSSSKSKDRKRKRRRSRSSSSSSSSD